MGYIYSKYFPIDSVVFSSPTQLHQTPLLQKNHVTPTPIFDVAFGEDLWGFISDHESIAKSKLGHARPEDSIVAG